MKRNKFFPGCVAAIAMIFAGGIGHGAEFSVREAGSRTVLFRQADPVRNGQWSSDGLTCVMTHTVQGNIQLYRLTFSTSTTRRYLLEVSLAQEVGVSLPLHFFDGRSERVLNAEGELARERLLDGLPLAAVNDKTTGLAVGLSPDSVVSTAAYRVAYSPGKAVLSVSARLVADAIRPQQLTLVVYDFTPEFGWRNAVGRYYDAFPSYFKPVAGVDSRIYGVGGYHTCAHRQRLFELHSARRSRMSWEWTYAPWYEAGNWYAAGPGWQGETNPFRRYDGLRTADRLVSREDFDTAIRREFQVGDMVSAMFFYVLVKDIHQNLADRYPDAVNGKSGLFSLRSNEGKTKAVFAPGSPIFAYLKDQLRELVNRYDISGFAFDMSNSSYDCHTPSQLQYAVGRSFDESGRIFTNDSILPIPFADYIHTLKRNGKTMGVYMNFALTRFSPFTVFHADGVMFEGNPDLHYDAVLPLRLAAGHKPMTFWGGVTGDANTGLRWELVNTPKERKQILDGLARFTLLNCLRYGIMAMNRTTVYDGGRIFLPWLATMTALNQAGFQVVPAIKGINAEKLWLGRFGHGAETILTVSNPSRAAVTAELQVVNSYLGRHAYLFMPSQEKELEQRLNGGLTSFRLTLAPKEIMVLRAVELSGVSSGIFKVNVLPGKTTLSWASPNTDSWRIAARRADFQEHIVTAAEGVSGLALTDSMFRGTIAGKDNSATWYYTSVTALLAAEEKITAFLTESARPVVVTAGKRPATDIALMIGMYRPYLTACRRFAGVNWSMEPGSLDASFAQSDVPAVSLREAPSGGLKIYVGTVADFPALAKRLSPEEVATLRHQNGGFIKCFDQDTLWLGGINADRYYQAAMRFLGLMDSRYDRPTPSTTIRK